MVKKFLKERMGSIILFAILILFVLWGVFSIGRARQSAITYETEYVAPEATRDADTTGSYASVAKNDKLELFYNDKSGAIQLKNLKTGYVWKSVVDNDVFDLSKVNKTWRTQMTSPMSVTYNDLTNKDPKKVTKAYVSDASKCNYLEYEKIDNGVSVTYGFLTPGIYITVDYILEDDELVVRIPQGKIEEKSKFAVMMIEMMPFFGAAGNEVEGYLFYPDGTGAVTIYENYKIRPSNVKSAAWYGYTPLTFTEASLMNDDEYDRYTMSMPVYGIKNFDNALFAVMSEGAESSRLVAYPSGESSINLNRIGFEMYGRNIYNVNMSNISNGTDSVVTGTLVQRLDKNLIDEDREIRYYVLDGDNANYSAMAGVYRDYLLETGKLTDSLADGETMPLALDLLMGAAKDGMVFEEYIPMTTFGQVEEIMDSLKEKGITNTEVVLRSWVTGSENKMNYWGPASKLGGKSGLKSLNEYASQSQGTSFYLETQFTEASDKTKGFSKEADVAYDGLDNEIATEYFDGHVNYLLNFQAAAERNEKFLSKIEKYDSLGVAYKWLGKYVFADSNENYPFSKKEAMEKLQSMLALADEKTQKVGVQGVNPYTYQNADYYYDMKESSYGRAISDYSVPFVEMVLSGLKVYSTEGAGNLSYDINYQMLKWAELGAVPYFSLTYESALNLRETDYDEMFSSTFADWEDTVVETYQKYSADFSPVFGQQMIKHEVLARNVVCVTYTNGYKVYLNYNDDAVTADGISIPGMEYVIVKGGN